jgi:hypothetical protein
MRLPRAKEARPGDNAPENVRIEIEEIHTDEMGLLYAETAGALYRE